MTTIAANRELMASDSKVTLDGFGISYPALKIFRGKDCVVGAAGDGENSTLLIEWAKNGFKAASRPKFRRKKDAADDADAVLLILRSSGLFLLTDSDSEPERIEADFFAVGSGGLAARVAMMQGADPVRAVELACAVDDQSGLPVQVIRLNEKE